MHIDRERNPAEADECDAEFFFAQEQPPQLGSAVPPLLECSFAWIGLEIQVMRNTPVEVGPRKPKQRTPPVWLTDLRYGAERLIASTQYERLPVIPSLKPQLPRAQRMTWKKLNLLKSGLCDERVDRVILPVGNGMTLACRRQ